jgi:hypothetical protein
MEKSLNQRWKESGTTLTYKEWRRREDEKMASFDGLSNIPKINIGDNPSYQKTMKELAKKGGYTEEVSNKTVLGINKKILLLGALIIVGAVGYKLYKKYKK